MTLPTLPREWCSTGTKTDPGAAAALTGFVAGNPVASAHVNFELNAHSRAIRSMLAATLLQLRYLPIETGVTLSDTAESMAAVSVADGARTLLIKTAQSFLTGDQARLNVTGVPASITSLVTDAASNGSRVVVIGTGGNKNTYSDDGGGSWAAGGSVLGTPGRIVWNATYSRFVMTSNSAIKYSSNAVAWTTPGSAADELGGIAVLSNGKMCYIDSFPHVSVSSDGATTWTGSFSLPNSADFDDIGNVAGYAGPVVYHAARKLSGTKLQVSQSSDCATWVELLSFDPPSGCTFSARPRLLACQQTGLLVLAAPVTASFSTGELALYASVDGVNWVGPRFAYPTPGTAGVAVANGRLFCTRDDLFFGADGCNGG